MTKIRALHGALACGAILTFGGTAHADIANYTIDPGSSQSNVDNACVGALPGATGEDCSYNAIDLWGTAAWVGPVRGSSYYTNGTSPFQTAAPGTNPLPEAPVPDPTNTSLAVTGSLAIDDKNTGSCDADDTISGRFEIAAGTRTFSGGPGTWGEETWGDNTIVYVLPESVPDFANAIAEGCEYIFGSAGFPSFIQTQGLSPVGIQTFPVDLIIGSDPINTNPPDSEQDAWAAPEPSGIGVGQFEGPNFQGNFGVEVSIDQNALTGGTWQCVDNFGDPDNPPTPSACNFTPAADGTPCDGNGSHFCGARAVQENWVMRIVVDPSGDIVEDAYIFANNESIVFAVPPAPERNNSWDGPVITFTAACDDCSVAKNDSYTFVTGTNGPVSLPIGANDDPSGQLTSPTTLVIDPPGPTDGNCVLTNNPGDVQDIACLYTATNGFNAAFNELFMYTLTDGILTPDFGLQATVAIQVQDDDAPVANDYDIGFDTQGVDPATLRNTTDVLDGGDVNGNAGGNNPTVTAGDGTTGTTSVVDGEITYEPNDDFFQGTDSFQYTIADDNFNSPGVAPESSIGTATVTIPDVVPTASDIETEVESGSTVDIDAIITAGNGTVDQHTVTSSCENGNLTVNSVGVNGGVVQVNATYVPDDGFSGEDTCTYTVTDEDGAGDAVDGTVTITVTDSGIVIKLPGAGSALGPISLFVLIPLALASMLRRSRTTPHSATHQVSGVENR